MKSFLLIVLFKLTRTYGSNPQINVNCTCTEYDVSSESDLPEENPSVLANLAISLAVIHDEHSAFALNISWAINIDYSNKYLLGTMFMVQGQLLMCCHYHPPFDKVNISGYEQWFHYTKIPAMPSTIYDVTGYNLPRPMYGNEKTMLSKIFYAPDCSNEVMRQHESCLRRAEIESEWEPNISSIFVNGQVEVSFTSSDHSQKYYLELLSGKCSSTTCVSAMTCKDPCEIISQDEASTQEGKSRWTRILNATGPCDSLHILITPYFSHCKDCPGKTAPVDCSQREPPKCALLVCLTCITLMVVLVAVLMWYQVYKTRSEFSQLPQATALPSVLVVYPAGNRAFQRAVVAFAEFLQSQWHCKVTIDVWEMERIAEQGLVRWLTTQTECAEKVVFVCTPRATSWESTAEPCKLTSLRDHTVPASAEDLFSLALNMMEGQMQGLSTLRKYCTVHLGDQSDAKHLPATIRACKSFSLMKDVKKLGRHLHNNVQEACCFPSVGLKPGALTSDATERLRDAIRQFQIVEGLQ